MNFIQSNFPMWEEVFIILLLQQLIYMKKQEHSVQKYINAKDKNEIVFTKGATEALNLVANTLGQKYFKEGDEVLITELEHHSNYVPWHFLRKSKILK